MTKKTRITEAEHAEAYEYASRVSESTYGRVCVAQERLLELLRACKNADARAQIDLALASLHRAGVLEGVWESNDAAATEDPTPSRVSFKDGDAVWYVVATEKFAASVKGVEYTREGCGDRTFVDLVAVDLAYWATLALATAASNGLRGVDVEALRPREGGR